MHTCLRMCRTAVFLIVLNWKQPNWPLTWEQISDYIWILSRWTTLPTMDCTAQSNMGDSPNIIQREKQDTKSSWKSSRMRWHPLHVKIRARQTEVTVFRDGTGGKLWREEKWWPGPGGVTALREWGAGWAGAPGVCRVLIMSYFLIWVLVMWVFF